MTKAEFYKELEKIGVDTKDAAQMKVWSLALLAMAQEFVKNRYDRCESCYYARKIIIDGKLDVSRCPNEFCPVKSIPDNASAAVEYIFQRDTPINMKAFFAQYVSPLMDKLIKKEEENARNKNS